MKRTLILAFALVAGVAQLANAATVVLTASDTTPAPGQTITLEARVTVTPADGTDTSLFGAVLFPTSGINTPTPGTQFAFTPVAPGVPFGLGSLSCTSARCLLFSQVSGLQGPQSGDVSNFLIGTQNYTIAPTTPFGTVLTWTWQTTPSTQRLDFFGAATPVPALTVTVIPEPTTAAMLGLGLLGLAMAGKRRA